MSFPLSLPAVPGIRDFRMIPAAVVGVWESPFTLSREIQDFGGDRWSCEFTLPAMRRATAEPWLATLLTLFGQKGTVLIGDPDARVPRGTASGTPQVDGANQTGRNLATKGWTALATNVLRAGDYIQLGTSTTTRLYKVLADASADAAGKATLSIFPRLRESPANSAAITTTAAKGTFRLASNDMSWATDYQGFYDLELSFVEAL